MDFGEEAFEARILNDGQQVHDMQEFIEIVGKYVQGTMNEGETTYLKYQKVRLNPVYLHEKNEKIILDSIKGVKFNC